VQEALEVASRSRTTICIAHRLSTIKNADNIIVMSNGEIIQQGTHDDLYVRDGLYRGLVDAQRISAETTGEGYETPEEVAEMEETLRRTQSHGSPTGTEFPDLLRKTTTARSASIVEVKNTAAGEVAKTKYSIFFLLKTVCTSGISINIGDFFQQARAVSINPGMALDRGNRWCIPGDGTAFCIWN